MKFSEESLLDENRTQNDNNEINSKQNNSIFEHSKKTINSNKNINDNNNISFFFYLNNFLEIFKPGFTIDRNNFDFISLKFPLSFLIVLILIKLLISNKFTIIYLFLLITLPFCALILINKIILEKYIGELSLSEIYNNNLLKDFHKLFLISIFPLIFFQYLTIIINSNSFVGILSNILFIIYIINWQEYFFI